MTPLHSDIKYKVRHIHILACKSAMASFDRLRKQTYFLLYSYPMGSASGLFYTCWALNQSMTYLIPYCIIFNQYLDSRVCTNPRSSTRSPTSLELYQIYCFKSKHITCLYLLPLYPFRNEVHIMIITYNNFFDKKIIFGQNSIWNIS